MSTCTNSEYGELLHAYENNQLSEEMTERFEIHLLECKHCFNKVKRFEEVTVLMRTDVDVKDAIKETAIESIKAETIWEKLRNYFWPEKSFLFKPALAYLIIILLIYPAYKGLISTEDRPIQEIRSIQFIPDRSSDAQIFKSEDDILLSFVFRDAVISRKYHVLITSDGGEVVFRNNEFRGFDKFQTGRLLLPAKTLSPGDYNLVIEDPGDEPPFNKQKYFFTIE